MRCVFVSDLHGREKRYEALFEIVGEEGPDAVFMGGDLLPSGLGLSTDVERFVRGRLLDPVADLRGGGVATRFFVILGNDDPRVYEAMLRDADGAGLIDYVHCHAVQFGDLYVAGLSFVPPTPFQLKDWERYDVSRSIDVGCVPLEQGARSVEPPSNEKASATISEIMESLARESPPERTIYLLHSPPYGSSLDRAGLDGMKVDHAPLDVHVGSVAIKRFIESRQPLLTLHGHVHESARITGSWRETFGRTHSFTAAHDGPELAIVRFETADLSNAARELVSVS